MVLRSIKSRFAAVSIFAATLGFATLSQAAPVAGAGEGTIAVQKAQMSSETDGLIQKAYHKGYPHHYKHKYYHKHHHYHHHYYHHH